MTEAEALKVQKLMAHKKYISDFLKNVKYGDISFKAGYAYRTSMNTIQPFFWNSAGIHSNEFEEMMYARLNARLKQIDDEIAKL